jgi:hypothetical protein
MTRAKCDSVRSAAFASTMLMWPSPSSAWMRISRRMLGRMILGSGRLMSLMATSSPVRLSLWWLCVCLFFWWRNGVWGEWVGSPGSGRACCPNEKKKRHQPIGTRCARSDEHPHASPAAGRQRSAERLACATPSGAWRARGRARRHTGASPPPPPPSNGVPAAVAAVSVPHHAAPPATGDAQCRAADAPDGAASVTCDPQRVRPARANAGAPPHTPRVRPRGAACALAPLSQQQLTGTARCRPCRPAPRI